MIEVLALEDESGDATLYLVEYKELFGLYEKNSTKKRK